jgi:hypothetical protein
LSIGRRERLPTRIPAVVAGLFFVDLGDRRFRNNLQLNSPPIKSALKDRPDLFDPPMTAAVANDGGDLPGPDGRESKRSRAPPNQNRSCIRSCGRQNSPKGRGHPFDR